MGSRLEATMGNPICNQWAETRGAAVPFSKPMCRTFWLLPLEVMENYFCETCTCVHILTTSVLLFLSCVAHTFIGVFLTVRVSRGYLCYKSNSPQISSHDKGSISAPVTEKSQKFKVLFAAHMIPPKTGSTSIVKLHRLALDISVGPPLVENGHITCRPPKSMVQCLQESVVLLQFGKNASTPISTLSPHIPLVLPLWWGHLCLRQAVPPPSWGGSPLHPRR